MLQRGGRAWEARAPQIGGGPPMTTSGRFYVDVRPFFEFLHTHTEGVQTFKRQLRSEKAQSESPYRLFLKWEKQEAGKSGAKRFLATSVQNLAEKAGYTNWERLLLSEPPSGGRQLY